MFEFFGSGITNYNLCTFSIHIINESCKFNLFFIVKQVFGVCGKTCRICNRSVWGIKINKCIFINKVS